MGHHRLIKRPDSTPKPDPRGYAYGLPPDMLRQTSFRLGMAALVYAGTYALAYFPQRLVLDDQHVHETTGLFYIGDTIAALFILVSVGLFFVTRRKTIDPARLLDLGLFYEIFGVIGIEIGTLFGPLPDMIVGISWSCVWIVVFPLIVPATPGKALLASLGAATMAPLMYLLSLARGGEAAGAEILLPWFLPIYVCVGIAVVGSRVVYQLRSEASKAHRMGSYRLVERLGSGGMGEVWRGEHRMLARPAAIKLIRPEAMGGSDELGKRELLKRFNREAQATAALSSPHTVRLYDFGVTEEGVFYYVMELLNGLDTASLIEKFGPLRPERVIYLLRQVCESLAEAHQTGLVHRDIKPANIYVCRLGTRFDFAKLLDFGLVKSSLPSAGGDSQLTLPHVAAGTPGFMAPEMVTGEGVVDGRADIYSLGCLAYWMLTGELVFSEGTPVQIAFAHANTQPEPPSRRTELEIPQALENVVMSCLEKDREKRPQTAEELAGLLSAAEGDPRWSRESAAQWWGKHVPDLAARSQPAETQKLTS